MEGSSAYKNEFGSWVASDKSLLCTPVTLCVKGFGTDIKYVRSKQVIATFASVIIAQTASQNALCIPCVSEGPALGQRPQRQALLLSAASSFPGVSSHFLFDPQVI